MAARKTSTVPTRIWKFCARFATRDDEQRARDLIYTSGRYYNRMVEIEQARVERFREIRARFAPELAFANAALLALDEQIGTIYRETRDARQRHFRESGGEKKRLLAPETQAKIDVLKKNQRQVSSEASTHRKAFADLLKPAQDEFKRRTTERCAGRGPTVKSKVNDEVLAEMLAEDAWSEAWKEIAHADDDAHRKQLVARNKSSLPSGTYLSIEEAFARAKKDSAPLAPSFHRLRPEGRLSVQLHDVKYADLVAGTTKCSISPAPRDPTKKGRQDHMVIVRIDQSIPRSVKQSVSATCKLHRQAPSDAEVKWAAWCIRRAGKRVLVELQLTLEHPSFAEPKRPAGTRATEHVQIGWARTDAGIRVAHWPGGEVIVPNAVLRQHGHAIAITSASDRLFVLAKKLLRRVMRNGPHRLTGWHRMLSDHARGSLRRACVGYAEFVLGADNARNSWRSWVVSRKARELDLFAMPREIRVELGIDAHRAFAFWCLLWAKKDEHLCQYAIDSARRFEHRRDAFFRSEAIRIATEFSEITVDSYDIAALKRLDPLTMPGEIPRDRAQHQLHEAAPGRFREILREVMGPRCTPCERSGDEAKPAVAREPRKQGSKRGWRGSESAEVGSEKGGARKEVGNAAE